MRSSAFGSALVLLALLSLAACSNPGGSAETTRTPGVATPAPVEAAPVATGSVAPVTRDSPTPATGQPAAPAPAIDPGAAAPVPILPTRPVDRPATPADAGRACATDADCALKDGGSCCGYRPVCVNKDTPTFPEEVKARCAQEGRVGICGFQALSGCQCVAGTCEGVPMMENGLLVQ